jgi:hypothetical protein
MTTFHISESGNPAPCKASVRACPRGGENEHYSSREAAVQAYERTMENELLAVFNSKDEYDWDTDITIEFREQVARRRRVEDAVLRSDPLKTVKRVPSDHHNQTFDDRDHQRWYVHPDFRKALPDDKDFEEYLLMAHHTEWSSLERSDIWTSYDARTGIMDISRPVKHIEY